MPFNTMFCRGTKQEVKELSDNQAFVEAQLTQVNQISLVKKREGWKPVVNLKNL